MRNCIRERGNIFFEEYKSEERIYFKPKFKIIFCTVRRPTKYFEVNRYFFFFGTA